MKITYHATVNSMLIGPAGFLYFWGRALKKQVKKKGRPRSENPMVHTAVVLPADLIARLKADAEAKGHGMSAEIRERLRVTYLMELSRGDPETGNLLHAIKHLSDVLERDLGKRWHQHPYAMAAFKAGLMEFLGRYQPEGEGSKHPGAAKSGGADDPADVVGRTHARLIGIAGHETEESYDPTNYFDEDPDVRIKREPASSGKKLKD